VKAVIQVGGLQSFVRPDPDQDEKRAWFRKVSRWRMQIKRTGIMADDGSTATLAFQAVHPCVPPYYGQRKDEEEAGNPDRDIACV
jgi:hypothetical protein